MRIATKLRINAYAFAVLAVVLCMNEATMRLSDEVRAVLALPLFNGIA